MSEHNIFLSDAEARAAPQLRLIVRPCEYQQFTHAILLPESVETERGPMEFPGRQPDYWLFHNGIPLVDYGFMVDANPLGAPGDVLLGKEAFALLWPENCDNGLIYDEGHYDGRPVRDDECSVEYRADIASCHPGDWPDDEEGAPHWQPSSRMPRWAVRHRFVVEQGGVMRVGEITPAQIEATGIVPRYPRVISSHVSGKTGRFVGGFQVEYAVEWDRRWCKSALGGRQFGDNPWAWFAWVGEENEDGTTT